MASSRLRIIFRPTLGLERHAVLRGVASDAQLLVPTALRNVLGAETWAGRTFSLAALETALAALVLGSSEAPNDTTTWDASDHDRLEIDLTLPILLLARDLRAIGLDGTLEVGGT